MKALAGLVLVLFWVIIYTSILFTGMTLSASMSCTDPPGDSCGIAEGFYIATVAIPAGAVFLILSAIVGFRYGARYFILGAAIGSAVMTTHMMFLFGL